MTTPLWELMDGTVMEVNNLFPSESPDDESDDDWEDELLSAKTGGARVHIIINGISTAAIQRAG